MASYSVRIYKGDYPARQQAANFDRAICYVEQHFSHSGGAEANYCQVSVATNAPVITPEWGQWYADQVSGHFALENRGVCQGGYLGRANDHLRHTDMPALLLEPCFISNPEGARVAVESQDVLAQILVESICKFFPRGGLVAFSIGHRFTPNPHDHGGRTPDGQHTEAELAEGVLMKAKALLEAWSSDDEEEPVAVAAASATAAEVETAPPQVEADPVGPDFVLPAHITRKMEIERKLEAEARERAAAGAENPAVAARLWVIDEGISDGARPHDPVTREEIWLMLYRALKK